MACLKLKYLVVLISSWLMLSLTAKGQADISMSTHWYNRATYNPASIARTEYIYFFTNLRQQWVGIQGAPRVFTIQGSSYFHDIRSAFGLSLAGEDVGVTRVLNPMATYAYRISDDLDWSMAFGISAGVYSRTINGSLFDAETSIDPAISYSTETNISPDANLGMEYQSNHFIFGLSTTHIFSINKAESSFLNSNHRYGNIIYKNENPEMFNYHFGIQVINYHLQTIVEGNAGIRIKRPTLLQSGPREIFDIGVSYRTNKEMTILFGVNLSLNLRVGYAYDQTFIPGYYTNTTHELMLEMRIPSRACSTKGGCNGNWYH